MRLRRYYGPECDCGVKLCLSYGRFRGRGLAVGLAVAVSLVAALPRPRLFSWPPSLVVIFVVALDEALLLSVS